ncbi:MAG: cell division protein FtsQ/DivIB [Planctomycetaceae bacterium]
MPAHLPDESDSSPQQPASWLSWPNLLLALSCGVAAWIFLPKLGLRFPDLGNDQQYRLRTSQIEISSPPHWVPHDLAEQVAQRSGLPDEISLLDKETSRRVAEAFERHPWVKGRVRVSVSVPARMRVELEYREPVAMVRVASVNGLFPIDSEATLLPSADFPPAEIAKYPLIDNVATAPSGAEGTVWQDDAVIAAARLAVLLKPNWQSFGLQSIRVPVNSVNPRAWDDLSLQLATRGGSRVIWGRAPGAKHPGELPADKKIERIKFYLKNHGPFDTAHGPCEYDITQWREIMRKPLADQGDSQRR